MAPRPSPQHSKSRQRRVSRQTIVTVALVLTFLPALRAAAPNAWDHALSLRTQLEATAAEQRTKAQYEEVLDAFRAVYHQRPDASKAPAAVAAVADLLAEKGRLFHDQRALRAAIGQFEFLRQQYPKSPQVDNALLLEGEICRQDLKDTTCAAEKFRATVLTQSGTSFAEQAALELKEMQSGKLQSLTPAQTVAKVLPAAPQRKSPDSAAINTPDPDATVAPPPTPVSEPSRPTLPSAQGRSGSIARITGMRHWSNPTSTRIAIDLGGKVEYEAARVPNPDRIFFDIHGARLAPSLNGHQVEVVDDGFLKRIRIAQFQSDVTRIVLDVTEVSQYSAFLLPNPWRLIIDIHGESKGDKPGSKSNASTKPQTTASALSEVAGLSNEPAKVPATAGPTSAPVSAKVPSTQKTADPDSLPATSDAASATAQPNLPPAGKSRKKTAPATADPSPEIPHAADPTAEGQRSLIRALGLKVGRIVIDAGHGGHDSGTLGPGGLQEKDVVLDVALRTGKLLHDRLGAEIVYTRDDDTFIPLETRTAIANKAQADLFLSIHGNSSPEPSARGVETYYLNFTSDPTALDVAARENAVSNHSVHQLSDLVRKITLKDKIDESREFAADVDASLYAGLKSGNPGLRDRGIKKAPFVVLIGAQMPSILAEISFITNPDDARQLREDAYKQRIAESLASGVERYLHGLSGTRPKEKSPIRSSNKTATDPASERAGK
jgi:N-acetylmuramoyl-L-alanine amidase